MVATPFTRVALAIALGSATSIVPIVAGAPLAYAQSPIDKRVCIAAAERGQDLRDGRHIRDARGQFALCARPECPAAVAKDCAQWVSEAEAALGSVKLEAVDGRGRPLSEVRVIIDGAPWSDEVPPTPVMLDPGSHEIRFEHAREGSITRTVALSMGDRDRVVRATFGGPPKAEPAALSPFAPTKEGEPKPDPSRGLVVPIVLAGVGAVSLGLAVTFWLLGNGDLDDARARCQAGCPESEADSARTKHLVGDIALGVGIVSLAAATYFLVTREKPRAVGRF